MNVSSKGFAMASLPPSRRRRRIWPWLLGLTALSIFLVAVVFWITISRSVSARLASAIAEAERDDPHWQIDDLMANREVIPDSENSAIVVARAVDLLPGSWPPMPKGPNPAPSETSTSVSDVFNRLINTPANVRLADPDVALLRDDLASYPEALRLARSVANSRKGRHELIIGRTLVDTLLPETQQARNVARLLHADAMLRAHDGDLDGALESCRAILGVGRSIGDEPFLISQLVRIAFGAVAMASTRRVLGQGEPSDEALARLQAVLEFERKQPFLLGSIRGERATLTELIRRVGAGEVGIDELSGSSKPAAQAPRPRRMISPVGKLGFDYQRAVAIEWINQLIEIAKKPTYEQAPLLALWEAEIQKVKSNRVALYTTTLPLLLMPAFSPVFKAQMRYEGELGATILLIAAERHRKKTGAWPSTIEAIDRAILPVAPLDPATGKPYRMKVGEGQLVFYSLGVNLKDEGGLYEPRKWMSGGADDVNATGWDFDRRKQASP